MLEIINNKENLSLYLTKNLREKKHIFYDIETVTLNQKTKKPSELLSIEYICAISYLYQGKVNYFFTPTLESFIKYLYTIKSSCKIDLTGQFIFGFDNHFLLKSLTELGYTPVNMERDAINVPYYTNLTAENPVECLRVKRKSSLSLKFKINDMEIETVDTILKSNSKLETMGKKLLNLNLIDEEYLKLDDFDYELYNKKENYTLFKAKEYARQIYDNLSERQLQYCRNDVVILALYKHHYKELYPNYDYFKMTLSQNIMSDYDTTKLSVLQLKNIFYNAKVEKLSAREKRKYETHIKYSDYVFNGINLYQYLKASYSGGLVIYNDKHIAKMINRLMRYVDRNSSYPHVIHKFPVPTFLKEFGNATTLNNLKKENEFSVFRMTIDEFNNMILEIDSHFIRCAFVKYLYKGKDDITINSNNLLLLEEFGVDLRRFKCMDYITFECKRFDTHEKIAEFYAMKQQSKNKNEIDATDVENIIVLDNILDKLDSTDEEIYLAKVSMNGLSGLPALRSTFPVYVLNENSEIVGYQTGFTNKERNCIFSIFVTSHSFYDLLHPLTTLTADEIDNYVYYTDTDSLIVDDVIFHKLDCKLDENNLGAWDVEYNIKNLYIANNKMYCFQTTENKIVVKSCGVRKDAFDTKNKTFDEFVKEYLAIGCKLPNLKNVLNKHGTISLYNAYTEIKEPRYRLPEQIFKKTKEVLDEIKRQVRNSLTMEEYEDTIYIETYHGALSLSECVEEENETDGKQDIEKIVKTYKLAKIYMRKEK